MNEFIVWDEENKEFYDDWVFFDNDGGDLYVADINNECHDPHAVENVNLKAFWSIGKTDIEGNKIYADSSVVEFDFRLFDEDQYEKLSGYFSFNADLAMYELREPYSEDGYRIYYLINNDIKNLKIVGTLQKNPDLCGRGVR